MQYLAPTLFTAAAFLAAVNFLPIGFFDVDTDGHLTASTAPTPSVATPNPETTDTRAVVTHVPLPAAVKAIYMTACVAGTPSFRDKLVAVAEQTEINAMVIDIKDYSGGISFAPESAEWQGAWQAAKCGARDMKEFIGALHSQGIYVIGRITVFQDPLYALQHPELAVERADKQTVWRDGKGLSFVDVAAKPYWDHIVALATDAYNIGFDELNFDYVRYPSDGNMADTYYPESAAGPYGMNKPANLEAFFKYLNEQLDDESRFAKYRHEQTGRVSSTPYTSVDLFGMTTTNFDDLSIGQVQDRAAPYFDFVAPMVYPSHYPNGFHDLGNPNDHPYEVVYYVMKTGVDRMRATTTPMDGFSHTKIMTEQASSTPTFSGMYTKPAFGPEKFRTWIQDFDYGGEYDANDVRAEIQASYDAGVNSFMIWAPSNIYTAAALRPAGGDEPKTAQ